MDLRVSVTDRATGEEICSELVPVVKAVEIELGQVDAVSEEKNEASVSFDVVNRGNIPANLTAVISILTGEDEKTELSRKDIGEVSAAGSTSCELSVPIDEKYQTIDETGGNGTFKLQIDILNGNENLYSTTASGAVFYSPEAIADVKKIESLSVEQTNLHLKKDEKAQINAVVSPASAAEDNKVIYASSDESVAKVNKTGEITAVGKGSAAITVYAVSKMEISSVQPDGSTKLLHVKDLIPDSMVKTQEITVSVSNGGSGSGGSSGSSSGKPAVDSSEGGTATAGKDGSVTITPDEGSRITGVIVNGKRVSIPKDGKLTGLTSSDKVEVIFEPLRTVDLSSYTDLAAGAWYTEPIRYAMSYGLFNGTSDTTFHPNTPMTRGMLAAVLHRVDGMPDGQSPNFDDVSGDQYYAEAVGWAAERGIVTGYGNGNFGPNDPITREQLTVMLWRYAGKPSSSGTLDAFTDKQQASAWAVDALRWAVENGVLGGYGDGRLGPQGQATRAQTAQMLKNFMENQADSI